MPEPKIKSVFISPQSVNTGEEYTIVVDAEAIFYFDDLDTMTWNDVEERQLIWNDIDDSE